MKINLLAIVGISAFIFIFVSGIIQIYNQSNLYPEKRACNELGFKEYKQGADSRNYCIDENNTLHEILLNCNMFYSKCEGHLIK